MKMLVSEIYFKTRAFPTSLLPFILNNDIVAPVVRSTFMPVGRFKGNIVSSFREKVPHQFEILFCSSVETFAKVISIFW